MKLLNNFFILLFLLSSCLLGIGCTTIGLVSDGNDWSDQTTSEKNSILTVFDGFFGSDDKVAIEEMVQVGIKDGVPVYDFSKAEKQDKDGDEKQKEKPKKKRKYKKIKDKRIRKAIVKIEEDNIYLGALENIRLQKLGYDTNTGEHKKLRALKRRGKTGRLVFNERKETYDVVVIENNEEMDDGKINYTGKSFATKGELAAKQTSSQFSAANNAGPKLYAPEYAVDSKSKGPKGAVQLVWTKFPNSPKYEIEILRNEKLFSVKQSWNVMHVMIFWGAEYLWRARVLDRSGQPLTAFADWKPLKVVPPVEINNPLVQSKPIKEEKSSRDAASIFEEELGDNLPANKPKNFVEEPGSVKRTVQEEKAPSIYEEELYLDQGGEN